jgi:hypothetical protein
MPLRLLSRTIRQNPKRLITQPDVEPFGPCTGCIEPCPMTAARPSDGLGFGHEPYFQTMAPTLLCDLEHRYKKLAIGC